MKNLIKGLLKGCHVLLTACLTIIGVFTLLSSILRIALQGTLTKKALIRELKTKVCFFY